MSGESERPEHDDVRRLLAQARHDEPIPADVAARMEALIAGLARTEPRGRDAEVVPFASRHRRRKAVQLLVAAAAVVVGGVGVSHLHLSGAPNTSATAGSPADSYAGGRTAAGANSGQASKPGSPKSTQALPVPQLSAHSLSVRHGRVVVRPGHFSTDVRAAQRVLAPASNSAARNFAASGCVAAPAHSTVVPATYERAPAALVYRRPEGSTRVVDLYLCGRPTPVRSVTLALP
jgi:hypothetical protein